MQREGGEGEECKNFHKMSWGVTYNYEQLFIEQHTNILSH